MRGRLSAFLIALAAGLTAAAAAMTPARAQAPDPENLLAVDTRHGVVLVQLRPDFAPGHVDRIKALARDGFYDGLTFHRVIADFMAQGGDPEGTGAGGSDLPDLGAEFTARVAISPADAVKIGEIRDNVLTVAGQQFRRINGAPIAQRFPPGGGDLSVWSGLVVFHEPAGLAILTGDGKVTANVQHCAGVASMARASAPNSANSQFFLMRGPAPWLDRQYSVWGRVVGGLDAVMALAIGEPPAIPDRMRAMRVVADLPAAQRPEVAPFEADAAALTAKAAEVAASSERGDFNACALQPETRVRWPDGSLGARDDPLAGMR